MNEIFFVHSHALHASTEKRPTKPGRVILDGIPPSGNPPNANTIHQHEAPMRKAKKYHVDVIYTPEGGGEATRTVDVEARDIETAITTALADFDKHADPLASSIKDDDGYEVWDNSSDGEHR